ncbi:hypothetical protein AB0D12_14650 [Streptomyces sp. NPDC048479]|uniref:hypothetical protein n=1 Tax=Streptomyces sp. NPDC048479 TaxID=3154725 RepID=UPI00342C57ED
MIDDLEMPDSPARAVVRRALDVAWWAFIVLISAPLLLVLGLVITYQVERATPEDYPSVAPEEMMRRATVRSQNAYEVLGFDRVVPPGVVEIGAGTENYLSTDFCHPGGLEGMADDPVDGAYGLYHGWALDKVSEKEALPALRRLHDHLKDTGWHISEYGEFQTGDEWNLRAERDGRAGDGGNETLSFTWRAEDQRFSGGSGMPCAYDPKKAYGDSLTGVHPPELRPGGGQG